MIPDIEVGYRGPEVCALTGITYRQLDYWTRSGLIVPSVSRAHGSGTQNRYSKRDVADLRIMHDLVAAGVRPERCRPVIDALHVAEHDLTPAYLIITDTEVSVAADHASLIEDIDQADNPVVMVVRRLGRRGDSR